MAELIILCFAFLFVFLPAVLITGFLERMESKRMEKQIERRMRENAGKRDDRGRVA